MKRTSEEWQKRCRVVVCDPDGWDRINYEWSWCKEKITRREFWNRQCYSTTIPDKDFKSHLKIWRDFPYTIIQLLMSGYWGIRIKIAKRKEKKDL